MTLNQTSGDALILVYLCIHFGQDCELDLVSYFYFNSILTSLNMTFKTRKLSQYAAIYQSNINFVSLQRDLSFCMIGILMGGMLYYQSYQKLIADDNPQMSSARVSDCCWFRKSLALLFCRHVYWTDLHPDYLFLMSFVRCQLTVTITLLLVFGPKASEVQRRD